MGSSRVSDPVPVRIIHRYAKNRSLYDTQAQRKTTVQEIAWMIRDGVTVQVLQDGQDMTAYVLSLIVADLATDRVPMDGTAMQVWVRQLLQDTGVGRESDAD